MAPRASPAEAGAIWIGLLVWALVACVAGAAQNMAERYQPCRRLVHDAPDDWRSYDCFRRVATESGDAAGGAAELEAILERDPERAVAMGYLANLMASFDPERAERLYRRAAETLHSTGRHELEVYQLIGLGDLLDGLGRTEEAGEQLDRAAEAAERSGPGERTSVGFAAARHMINALEDYGGAWRHLLRMETALFPDGELWQQHGWLELMGSVCWYLGRHRQALEIYRLDAELLRAHDRPWQEAIARNNIALLAKPAGLDHTDHVALQRQALDVAVSSGNRQAEAVARARLSGIVSGPERLELARRAVALARGREQLEALAAALVEQEPAAAFELLEEAGRRVRELGNRSEIARNAIARAHLRWQAGPRDAAIAASLAALDAIEATRDLQPHAEVRARRFGQWGLAYETFVSHLLAGDLLPRGSAPGAGALSVSPADLELAFATLERRRARGLLDELDAAHATEALGSTEAQHEEYEALLSRLSQQQRRLLDSGLSAEERQVVLAKIETLELDLDDQAAEITLADSIYGQVREPRLASLREVQESLDPGHAMLLFQLAEDPDGSYLLLITHSNVTVERLPGAAQLLPAVDLYLGLLEFSTAEHREIVARAAGRLYRDLVEPIADELSQEIDELTILADGSLHALPFGALRPAIDAEPLASRFAIATAPSATTWLRWQRRPAPIGPTRALALADPQILGKESWPGPAIERGWTLAREVELGSLPYAHREGRRLVRAVGNGSVLRTGAEASEHFLKESDLTEYSVLHFAAHGIVDHDRPSRSAIVLAPGDGDQDGLLQVREVVQLDLIDKLVVLSACQSAAGLAVGGEGILGLSRGFFVAGARAVVGSLWPLRDRQAADLFEDFYRHLTRGESVAEALAAAQRRRIARGDPPSDWAGVVLIGDGGFVPFPGGVARSRWRWGLLAALITAVGLTASLLGARRRQPHRRRLVSSTWS